MKKKSVILLCVYFCLVKHQRQGLYLFCRPSSESDRQAIKSGSYIGNVLGTIRCIDKQKCQPLLSLNDAHSSYPLTRHSFVALGWKETTWGLNVFFS